MRGWVSQRKRKIKKGGRDVQDGCGLISPLSSIFERKIISKKSFAGDEGVVEAAGVECLIRYGHEMPRRYSAITS